MLLLALVANTTGLEAANLDNDRDRLRAIAITKGRVVGEAVLKTKAESDGLQAAELTVRVESDSPNLTVIHRPSGSVISSE